MNRRLFLAGLLGFAASCAGLGTAYATAVEPFRQRITRYAFTPRGWPKGLRLRVALLADFHAHPRFLGPDEIDRIVARTNALEPDLVLGLGDYGSQERETVPPETVARHLLGLKARYGTYFIQGNHDLTDDLDLQRRGSGMSKTEVAFREAGLNLLESDAVALDIPGRPLWLAGLPSEYTIRRGEPLRRSGYRSQRRTHNADTMARALDKVPAGAPVLLMAHEPDVFALDLDPRVVLQVSGHTHGGQIRLMGWSPFIPSRYGLRYAYGHIQEGGRDLVVSAGLGSQCLLGRPIRIGAVPEIVLLELGGAPAAA